MDKRPGSMELSEDGSVMDGEHREDHSEDMARRSSAAASQQEAQPNYCDIPADLQERIMDRAVRQGTGSPQQLADLRTVSKSFKRAASRAVCYKLAPASLRESEVRMIAQFPSVRHLDLSNVPDGAVEVGALRQLDEFAQQLQRLTFYKNFPDNSLDSIANLRQLQELELSGVGFTETDSKPSDPVLEKRDAPGPPYLGMLSALAPLAPQLTEILVEGAGQFEGGIVQLSVLTGLRKLRLRGFSMAQDSGLILLGQRCSRLESLSILNRREYIDVSLAGLREMTNLTALHLQGIGRVDPCELADTVGRLTTLVKLDLPEYTLDGVLGGKSLSQLTRLEAISISGDNYFSMETADGGWLTGLGRLTGLTSAKFYGFVDMDYDTFRVTVNGWSPTLKELKIEATDDFGADHVLHICNRFPNLTGLALNHVPNAINDATCCAIARQLTSLCSLDVTGFAGSEAPHCLGALAGLPHLQQWSLRAAGDLSLAPVAKLSGALTLLNLSGAELAPELDMEEELRSLQRLQHLAALDLSVWGLQPGAAAVVAAFPALQALSLASSTTVDGAVAELAAATGLTSLDLSGCRYITPKGVAAGLTRLPHLKVLRLADAGAEGTPRSVWPPQSAFANRFIGVDRRTDVTALD
jgi:hypothetical protein